MNAPGPDTQRAAGSLLDRAATMGWFHWSVVALSAVLTLGAASLSKHQIDARLAARFDVESQKISELIAERMSRYEDALWAGVVMLESHDLDVDLARWRRYVAGLRTGLKYPGINGIGVIHHVSARGLPRYLTNQRRTRPDFRVHPRRRADLLLPITFIEPVRGNREAVGLDVAHEQNQLAAALRARDTGEAQITGPITLVQDAGHTAGFLFYAPFYRGGPHATAEARREHFAGLVYAPFVVRKLMEGTLAQASRGVAIRITDGESVIYDELRPGEPGFDPSPAFRATAVDVLYGRPWAIEIWSRPEFRPGAASSQPLTILVAGLAIDGMLLFLFLGLSRANRRGVDRADAITHDLRLKAERLESANQDLEKMSFLASHDLKTPIRGIANIVGFIHEDCKDVVAGPVQDYLDRIMLLTRRINEMLDDLFEYSCLVNRSDMPSEWVGVEELVDEIHQLNDLDHVTIDVQTEVDGLMVPRVLMKSILNNLVTNAAKHGIEPDGSARVEVGCRPGGEGMLEFSVRDFGDGIPDDKTAMVFEMFKQLKSRDEIGGTGVGLAVVRHVVTRAGGSIWIERPEGGGARFVFLWPEHYALGG